MNDDLNYGVFTMLFQVGTVLYCTVVDTQRSIYRYALLYNTAT